MKAPLVKHIQDGRVAMSNGTKYEGEAYLIWKSPEPDFFQLLRTFVPFHRASPRIFPSLPILKHVC